MLGFGLGVMVPPELPGSTLTPPLRYGTLRSPNLQTRIMPNPPLGPTIPLRALGQPDRITIFPELPSTRMR
jgi:hypothetical protein